MATNKYLTNNAGVVTELAAAATGGGGDANKVPTLDAGGQLTAAMMPTGFGAATVTAATSETIAAGDFVEIYDVTGTSTVRKATANGKPANGFCLVGFTHPTTATIYLSGNNSAVAGTPAAGTRMYLSGATPGLATATAPTTSGYLVQYLGTATSTTVLPFNDNGYVVLA